MMTERKYEKIMTVLLGAEAPMSAADIAKKTGAANISSRDAGNMLRILEGSGKVRRIVKACHNYWEAA